MNTNNQASGKDYYTLLVIFLYKEHYKDLFCHDTHETNSDGSVIIKKIIKPILRVIQTSSFP